MRYVFILLTLFCASISLSAQDYSVTLETTQNMSEDGELLVCSGTTVSINAIVDYGTTGADPEQTEYEWTFDGNPVNGFPFFNSVEWLYTFYTASTHTLTLTVTNPDVSLISSVSVDIWVSAPPNFELLESENINSVYLGDEATLYSSLTEGEQGFVFPPFLEVESETENGYTLFLPDGSGNSYSTNITIESAEPDATVGNEFDIPEIWSALEHSYLGDLDIEITCPNGSTVVLQSQGGGSCNLGFPWATGSVDGSSSNISLGIPLLYTWNVDGISVLDQECVDDITFISGDGPDTYTDSQVPSGVYASYEPLTNLLSCPINGDWTLTITDNIAADNGYIFSWGMSFDDGLVPMTPAPIDVDIVNLEWLANDDITANIGDNINVAPSEPGTAEFTIRATDSFFCTYDHALEIEVLWPLAIDENELVIQLSQYGLQVKINIDVNEVFQVRMYDIAGHLVHDSSFKNAHDITMTNSGVYLLELINEEGEKSVRKLSLLD